MKSLKLKDSRVVELEENKHEKNGGCGMILKYTLYTVYLSINKHFAYVMLMLCLYNNSCYKSFMACAMSFFKFKPNGYLGRREKLDPKFVLKFFPVAYSSLEPTPALSEYILLHRLIA
jgi:hypothetical protein